MARSSLPKNLYRRRGRIGARVQIEGRRVRLGEWPDTPEGRALALASIKQAKRDVEDGIWVAPSELTTGTYLERWLERRERMVALGEIRATTHESSALYLRTKVMPRIGSIKLDRLTADDVERMAVKLLHAGSSRAGPLSRRTVSNILKALRVALNAAVSDGLIPFDPSRGVKVATSSHQSGDFDDLATWTAHDLADLLPRLNPMDRQMIALAASTGLRRSELCGLLWRNVDLDAGVVRVRSTITMVSGEPVFGFRVKSRSSSRSIAADASMVALLRERKADQARERLAAGPTWHDDVGFVFTWSDGRPTSPEWFTKKVQKVARQHGLKPIGSHGLRHTFATIALENGANLKVVSEALGHADIGVTADVYSHVTENAAREAAAIVGAAIFGTRGSR